MKNIYLVLVSIILFVNCSSYQSIESFYDNHKNDPNASSFQLPTFLKNAVKNVSPELSEIVGDVDDFRSISFKDCSVGQDQQITQELNSITKNYKDVVRKNENGKNISVSVKEKGNVIKEVILHSHKENDHYVMYLKGNFDTEKINRLAETEDFESLGR
ncbi:DUF4252 domain-containing protein [Namhaeicola litoreus]|uniref:DUF4252 domain-containing protein n=1 Tax=Namhaeicola litoreus TaxID=1052145 RepID=A0ABW3Y442_9FLAO